MTQLKEKFDRVKYDALEYVGLYNAPTDDLGSILAAVVARQGADVFDYPGTLHEEMTNAGASEAQCCQVYLMTQVSGFHSLMDPGPRAAQLNLDRYIQNAVEETGFSRDTILRLTGGIVSSIGGTLDCVPASAEKTEFPPPASALLASSLYEKPLRAFQAELDQVQAGRPNAKLNFDRLEPLANLGIPRAKYYLGYCILNGIQVEANEERGLELLRAAADLGDSRAAAALGDYYYALGGSDHWTKAYQYYTGFGAAALTGEGKSHVASILNQERFNRKLLRLCIGLLAVCVATVIWPQAAAVYAPHPVWGWAAAAAQLALLVLGCLHHAVRPYDFIYWLPAAMSGIWFAYMAVRLLF